MKRRPRSSSCSRALTGSTPLRRQRRARRLLNVAQTSVAQFASELKVPPSVLLEQLRAAGVDKKVPEDSLSESDKSRLLDYLRRHHGSGDSKTKITLTRKQTSEIRKTDATGKYRTVQVEV